jgi:hypothetical protein
LLLFLLLFSLARHFLFRVLLLRCRIMAALAA